MKQISFFILFLGAIYFIFFNAELRLLFYKEQFLVQAKLCQNAKKDFNLQDFITTNETDETKINVFMNAKYNLNSCYDLDLLKSKLISNGVSAEKIQYLEFKSIEDDSSLIEFVTTER